MISELRAKLLFCLAIGLWFASLPAVIAPERAAADGGGPGPHVIPDDYLFAFAVIADSHIRIRYPFDSRKYLKAMSISRDLLANCVEDINNHRLPIDFVVHLGDVTDWGETPEFDAAQEILDELNVPLYPLVGNHDNFKSDGKERWKRFARRDSTQYSFNYFGFHFLAIDCTMDPYEPPYVDCDSLVREWVRDDLWANRGHPTIVLSHFNMWRRGWNAQFDTTESYQEYASMPELRSILEESGDVVAVLNGHVHANRVEVHNGIYYVDINATLVGRPSIRYFYVYPSCIVVDYEYLSDTTLLHQTAGLCTLCTHCFDRHEVCDFIDGRPQDKAFVIPVRNRSGITASSNLAPLEVHLSTVQLPEADVELTSDLVGVVQFRLYDVLGKEVDRAFLRKSQRTQRFDLAREFEGLEGLAPGVYFLRIRLQRMVATRKLLVVK